MSQLHSEVLLSAADLRATVKEIGDGIAASAVGVTPVLVAVLKGAVPFVADLVRVLPVPADVDFLSISAFGPGKVRIEKDLSGDIADRHVIIVEDIVDTGLTLSYLIRTLSARGPAVLEVATLLDRPHLRLVDVPVRWTGREIDERFVVGYGMDFERRYRNLPDVRVVKDLAALAADPDLLNREVYGRGG